MSLITEALLLSPYLAERPWGGTALGEGIGEAWDLSVHPNGPSLIAAGAHKGKTLAAVVDESPESFGGPIRLLAKRLDCAQNLSVQVHPQVGDPKTEAWAVLANEPGAGIYHGVNRVLTKDDLRSAVEYDTLPELLHFETVTTGQAIFVPAGTIHAIGGGLQLFELQQSSDTTYRLYDWGRNREMHLDEGVACSLLSPSEAIPPAATGSRRLIECEYFYLDWCESAGELKIDPADSWAAIHLLSGSLEFPDFLLEAGQTAIVPQSARTQALRVRNSDQIALVFGPYN